MPAFETRMSMPPYSAAASVKARATPASSVTSRTTPRTESSPCDARNSSSVASSDFSSMSASTQTAPSPSSRRTVARPMPPAPPVTKRDLAGEAFRLRHALQLRLLEQPVFDVEGFLLRQAEIIRHGRSAAHHVDGVDIKLAGDARGRLVLGEGDLADAGHQIDHRDSGRAWPGNPAACSARSSRRSGCDSPRPGARQAPPGRCSPFGVETTAPAARSSCAGNGPGRTCRAPPARRGASSRRIPARHRNRRNGRPSARPCRSGCGSPASASRRWRGGARPASGATASPPKAALPAVSRSNQAMARLITSSVSS